MHSDPESNAAIVPSAHPGLSPWRLRLLLMGVAGLVYFLTPVIVVEPIRTPGHFREFAAAMLAGHVSIKYQGQDFASVAELIPTLGGDRLYLAYPPLPAVLMIPFVALFGVSVSSQLMCRCISILNVAIFDACLNRFPATLDRPAFTTSQRVVLDILMAFGTVTWHNAHFGGDWHYAHAVTLCAALLALFEFTGKRRPLLIGLCMAAIILTRPTAALVCIFFLLPWLRKPNTLALLIAAIFPLAATLVLGGYNHQRFGDPFDFGYSQMFLSGRGAELMESYGQFNIRFVRGNAFWFFIAPPWITPDRFPWLAFDPHGMGLFFATPALLYIFVAMVRHSRADLLQNALVALLAAIVPLLAYFNTGFMQFGHRFSMDYLAILLLLAMWGMGRRISRLAVSLIVLSVFIQAWGILLHNMVLLPAAIAPAA